jgi:signal transduction histidine kinase
MPSPNADHPTERKPGSDLLRPLKESVPSSFQTRLTYAFVGVVALTLALVSPVVINRFDDYVRDREAQELLSRQESTATFATLLIAGMSGGRVVVADEHGDPALSQAVRDHLTTKVMADLARFAQADVTIWIGMSDTGIDGRQDASVKPLPDAKFTAALAAPPDPGLERDPSVQVAAKDLIVEGDFFPDWGVRVELSAPFTSRASTVAAITGLLLVIAIVAFAIAVVVAAILSRRFTAPLRRLTEASRAIAEGDLASRVSSEAMGNGTLELIELADQFNTMADRLQESVAIIRRDRDRSRDFLADVSHELRTPIAALRTFTELLQGDAGAKPETRAEFLESSAVQLERLDWLAQNLLELSKLDSGLVLLDLRPEDLRATVESAVEQAEPAARRRGVALHVSLPDGPLRIRHDPPRVGQIVINLIGNAVKFTDRGGSVHVQVEPAPGGAARIEVSDTGVGIAADELPRVFERFFRGSRASEARSSGSGLGLAIVKSIVDMHGGTIAVESSVGHGSRFVVTLPRDPRDALEAPPGATREEGDPNDGRPEVAASITPDAAKVADSSPADLPGLNREGAR